MDKVCDILFVCSEFPPGPGGLGEHAYQIARGLSNAGYRVVVACNQDYASPSDIDTYNNQLDESFELIPFSKKTQRFAHVSGKLHELWSLCRKRKPRLLMCSGSMSTLYASFIAKVMRIPRLIFIHGPEYQKSMPATMGKYILKGARLITVSNHNAERLNREGFKQKIHVINNGGDTRYYHLGIETQQLKQELGLEDHFIVLTVGRLCERKGQKTVIEAMKKVIEKHPKTAYLMVGHEEKKKEFEKQAKSLGIENNIFAIGQVSHEDLPKYYALSDLYILNSTISEDGDQEGFGISIIEAALCGKAAIGTRGCGIEDAIEHEKTGLLIPDRQVHETYQAILHCIENPDDLENWSKAARQRAIDHFTWEKVSQKVCKLIESSLSCPANS